MAQRAVPRAGSGHAWAGLGGKVSALSPGGSTGPGGVVFRVFAWWSGANPSMTRMAMRSGDPFREAQLP